MESNYKMVTVVVAVVLGMLVGGGIGYAVGHMNNSGDAMKAPTTTVAANKDGVTVGGALMVRNKDIVDNAAGASNVTTLVSLVKLADLVDTLKGTGPFTVFGPDNNAFGKLPAATVASLQEPANKAALANILTYHVVSGTYTSAALKAMAAKGETLTTVQGQVLKPVLDGDTIWIQDAMGGKAAVETADVISSNGVTHVIDSVLMPKS